MIPRGNPLIVTLLSSDEDDDGDPDDFSIDDCEGDADCGDCRLECDADVDAIDADVDGVDGDFCDDCAGDGDGPDDCGDCGDCLIDDCDCDGLAGVVLFMGRNYVQVKFSNFF